MTAKITIRGLGHEYVNPFTRERVVALDGVDLDVEEGEFLTVVGPSGCGKTTLLNVLAGLLPKTRGTVLLDGREVTGPGPDRGVVFQVGLRGFERKYPHELSGGMKQRVAVARTLAANPEVMLMDEPFASVDSQTRITLQEELNAIAQATRKTILFVTHNVEEAVFLGDRCCVLSGRPGRVKALVPVGIPRARRRWNLLMSDGTFDAAKEKVFGLVREEVGKEV